jgi:amidase
VSEPHYQPLTDVSRMLEAHEVSSVELTELILARIEAVDSLLFSYATPTPELALGQARRADAELASGRYRGPLHGAPVAVKDLCYTAGIVTAGGMPSTPSIGQS